MLKVKGVGLYGDQVSGAKKKLKYGVKSITMKMVLFSLVYIIKPSVHMDALEHMLARTHLHTTHLFWSRVTLSYGLNV